MSPMGFLQSFFFSLLLIVYTNSDVYTCINDVQTQKISNVQNYIDGAVDERIL